MASQRFIYTPINTASKDIRLLRLLARDTRGPPSCEIFHASLNEDTVYEALSYTWGNPRLRRSIFLNGTITFVTVNLAKALEDIRFDHGVRVLWVDALCINQNDTMERNHQVKRMGAIYQNAKRVVVWLGQQKDLWGVKTESILDSLDNSFNRGLGYAVEEPNLREKWVELIALCELPYWRRLWIIQEIGLAAEIHIYHGRSWKDWRLFSIIRRDVERKMKKSYLIHEALQGIGNMIMESVPGRLDEQREYKQPLWLREMHDAIHHLISRAQNASRAATVLLETVHPSQRSTWSFFENGSSSIKSSINAFADVNVRSSNIQEVGLYEETNINTRNFASFLIGWESLVNQDSVPFSLKILDANTGGDFENIKTQQRCNVNIPCFLPLCTGFTEAYVKIPRHIEYLRAHESQIYFEELKKKCDEVLALLQLEGFPELTQLENPIYSSRRICHSLQQNHERLKKKRIICYKGIEKLLRTELVRFVDPKESEEDFEIRKRQYDEKITSMQREYRDMEIEERKLEYISGKQQEIMEYLLACRRLRRAFQQFDEHFESGTKVQQPAFLLRNLLETSERSLCQDPRDKVYGLLGLAANVKESDIVVDYAKSMFEIFWDVIWHTYGQEGSSDRNSMKIWISDEVELVRFSQLIQRSLGGPFAVDIKFKEFKSCTELSLQPPVCFPGFITGNLLQLDIGDIDSSAGQHLNRAELLEEYFRNQFTEDTGSITNRISNLLEQIQQVKKELLRPFTTRHSYGTTDIRQPYHFRPQNAKAEKSRSQKDRLVLFVEDSGLVVITSSKVRDDDLLVQFSSCDIALIVRPCAENENEFLLVARAVVARRFDETRKTVSASSRELFQHTVPDRSKLLVEKMIWFWADAVTLQDLTCPVSDKREFNFDTLSL